MKKTIISTVVEAVMAALLYFGVFNENVYAANIFWAVFWVFILITVLMIIATSVDDLKEKFKEGRKPRSKVRVWYSFTYDTFFALSLAALGFLWSGAIWWMLQLLANTNINLIDDEIREEQKNDR